MAQFRATIQGQRGAASRLGSKRSGLTVTANGWTAGVRVSSHVSAKGEDRFEVMLTSGSRGDLPCSILFTGTAAEIRERLQS